jgi:hypothetical protein
MLFIQGKLNIKGTLEEFFQTEGGITFKESTSESSSVDSGKAKLYYRDGEVRYVGTSGSEQIFFSLNDIEQLEELENSLTEICWYFYTAPKIMSNYMIDGLDDQSGIASVLSDYVYDEENDWVEPSLIGTSVLADITALSDIERWNLIPIGSACIWRSTEPDNTKGYFSLSGEGAVLADGIGTGCEVSYSGGSTNIADFSGGGDEEDEVEVDDGITDLTTITTIYGLTVSDGNITPISGSGSGVEIHNVGYDQDNDEWAAADRSFRIQLAATDISGSATTIQVTIHSGEYDSLYIQKASIGEMSGSGPDTVVTPIELTDFSGQTIAAGFNSITSGNVSFAIDSSKDYIVVIDIAGTNGAICEKNSTNGSYWYKDSTDSYDQASVSGFTQYSGKHAGDIRITAVGEGTYATEPQVACSSALQLNTSAFQRITQILPIESSPGNSTIYHTICFNKYQADETWKIYSSGWRDIAKLDSGTWKYLDASDVYQSSDSRLDALADAMGISENQMDISAFQRIGESEYNEVFYPGTLDFGWRIDGETSNTPTFDKHIVYKDSNPNLKLVEDSFEAKSLDPASAYVVIKIKSDDTYVLNSDITAWVSINDGTSYHQATLSEYKDDGTYQYIRGSVYGITARNDKTIRVKINTHAMKDIKVTALAVGVRNS